MGVYIGIIFFPLEREEGSECLPPPPRLSMFSPILIEELSASKSSGQT